MKARQNLNDEPSAMDLTRLKAIREAVSTAISKFDAKTTTIMRVLASHSDLDVRFLGVRLDFSGFYRAAAVAAKEAARNEAISKSATVKTETTGIRSSKVVKSAA